MHWRLGFICVHALKVFPIAKTIRAGQGLASLSEGLGGRYVCLWKFDPCRARNRSPILFPATSEFNQLECERKREQCRR